MNNFEIILKDINSVYYGLDGTVNGIKVSLKTSYRQV